MSDATSSSSQSSDLGVARVPWWKAGPIYQIFPRSFSDSSGDGVGDIRGIISKLDYLNNGSEESLSVKAIWLSPIYVSPGRDAGYDVSEHTVIDPMFGTMEDFEVLIAECKKLDIKVIMDIVLNHTSNMSPWFIDSLSSKTSAHRDWFIWSDPKRGGGPPNNWLSWFGGPGWTFDEDSQQYYMHTFKREQPELNWRNPEVRAACLDVMRFWLDRGVSGLRLDVFNAYFKHPELLDNPRRLGMSKWNRQHQINNKNQPDLHGYLDELRAMLDSYPEAMAVGETFDGRAEVAASYCKKLHMGFNFNVAEQKWHPRGIQDAISKWNNLLSDEDTWPCYFMSNHDLPRHSVRFSKGVDIVEADARAKVVAAMMFTLRGTPFVYYGEEIGMRDVEIPEDEQFDTEVIMGSRDPARTPMQWDSSPNAGFSSATPWLRISTDYKKRNVELQESDPHSILNFYRRVSNLRANSPVLLSGTWRPLIKKPDKAMVYLREYQGQYVLVALNFTNKKIRVKLDANLSISQWRLLLSTCRESGGNDEQIENSFELEPYEASIFSAQE